MAEDPTREILQRVRRIETRVTALSVALGVDTNSQKPKYYPKGSDLQARVELPSPHSSMREILDSIPDGCDGPVRVFIGAELVACIDKVGNSR